MARNVIKWTWFHRNCSGKNRVVQNTIVDWAMDVRILRLWFESHLKEAVSGRGMTLHRRDGNSATFLTKCGDFVNIRLIEN